MPYAVLEKQLKALPEEYLEDVAKYVELLQYKVAAESACQPQKRAVVPGLLAGKFTQTFCKVGTFNIFSRLKMVGNQRNFFRIKNGLTDAFKFFQRRRSGNVVSHNQIQVANYKLPCLDAFNVGMTR